MEIIQSVFGPLPAVVAAAGIEIDEPRSLDLDAESADFRRPPVEELRRRPLELLVGELPLAGFGVVDRELDRGELFDRIARDLAHLRKEAPGLLEGEDPGVARTAHRVQYTAEI